jgi:hypothetical protein
MKKINWMRLENRIRKALENYQRDLQDVELRNDAMERLNSCEAALYLIDEIVAEETRRGNSLDIS